MFKKIFVGGLVAVVLVAGAAGIYQKTLAAQAESPAALPVESTSVLQSNSAGQGNGGGNGQSIHTGTNSQAAQDGQYSLPAAGDLSQEEAEALLFMREEEKLARDVYTALYAVWGQQTFTNIAASEQAHMDAIKNLLDVYSLTDSASSEAGVFNNPDLQALYDQLVAQGSQSLADALKAGAAIEEIDILDLQTRLAQTDNVDIQQVYNSLLRGSENHLRSFVNVLQTQTGETYQPQYLTAEAYQAILAGSQGGYGQGGQGSGQGGGQGGQGQGGQGGGNGYHGGRP